MLEYAADLGARGILLLPIVCEIGLSFMRGKSKIFCSSFKLTLGVNGSDFNPFSLRDILLCRSTSRWTEALLMLSFNTVILCTAVPGTADCPPRVQPLWLPLAAQPAELSCSTLEESPPPAVDGFVQLPPPRKKKYTRSKR